MNSHPLELQIDNLHLKIAKITSLDLFSPSGFTSIAHTVTGAAIARGRLHEQRLIWKTTCLLTDNDSNIFRAIYDRAEKKRKTFQNPSVLLFDKTQKFVEPPPRTRSIVPGTSENTINGVIEYFAIFQVYIINFKQNREGKYISLSFDMMETDKTIS